jgi:hypothetical protein
MQSVKKTLATGKDSGNLSLSNQSTDRSNDMNIAAINEALNTLAANAEFNNDVWGKYHAARDAANRSNAAEPAALSAEMFKPAQAVINGYWVCAYFVPAKGRTGSTRWQLSDHGGRVARANLVKILEEAA